MKKNVQICASSHICILCFQGCIDCKESTKNFKRHISSNGPHLVSPQKAKKFSKTQNEVTVKPYIISFFYRHPVCVGYIFCWSHFWTNSFDLEALLTTCAQVYHNSSVPLKCSLTVIKVVKCIPLKCTTQNVRKLHQYFTGQYCKYCKSYLVTKEYEYWRIILVLSVTYKLSTKWSQPIISGNL